MIFINKDNISEENINSIEKEKEFLYSSMSICKKRKELILNYMQSFADSTKSLDRISVNVVLRFLEDLKTSLELYNQNLAAFDNCINNIDNLIFSIKNKSRDLDTILKTFNSDYAELNNTILENTLKVEDCLYNISKTCKLEFIATPMSTPVESKITDEIEISKNEPISDISTSDATSNVELENYQNTKYPENTLTISEISKKVTLPYKISDVNDIYEKHPEKYSSIDGVISKIYTLPISMFKNPFTSRFKEAFKLIRKKEHGSIIDAFELGSELMFNSNLHPAIISACKNLDELDIYLDYLESGKKSTFDCFKVIFEMPPIATKKRKNSF